ncbi:sulfate ABC transporter permease subunit CysT [Gaiella sp.]|jgi:sulfate transport system permease protein|uniref:sulfate ABC transporter permease subunit CysT n=1 Tax=Gaiella sp. TaxID=2663207 RepID=UPI002E337326|nr:sulfate ABC transporter permease subunit CysT [Gaiella sp.]HEX5585542.1 sulfate ABC transporter permease subunit CysT [Gaiella sp.]
MASVELVGRASRVRAPRETATALSLGFVVAFLSVVVALPMAALAWAAADEGWAGFWETVSSPQARAALELSFGAALVVAVIDGVAGTLIAWVLVRDEFRGKRAVDATIDLPFALPTIVAGLVLLALYGPSSPIGVDVAFTRTAIVLALLFVTLPFVVRTVQPVLHELDTEMEQAARSLGASELAIFRRIVVPNLLPGILSGVALAFARAIGEIGALVIISGSLPYKTEVASVYILSRVESGDQTGAAAIAVVLLLASFLVILAIGVVRRLATRHEAALARA